MLATDDCSENVVATMWVDRDLSKIGVATLARRVVRRGKKSRPATFDWLYDRSEGQSARPGLMRRQPSRSPVWAGGEFKARDGVLALSASTSQSRRGFALIRRWSALIGERR